MIVSDCPKSEIPPAPFFKGGEETKKRRRWGSSEGYTLVEVIATIVDLARRGYLEITDTKKEGVFSKPTTIFTRLKPLDDLEGFEAKVAKALFDGAHPDQVTTTGIPDMDVDAYMNPYINNVLDVQKARASQDFAEQQQSRDSKAIAAGAFGGDRRFVADSLAQRDLNQQLQATHLTDIAGDKGRIHALLVGAHVVRPDERMPTRRDVQQPPQYLVVGHAFTLRQQPDHDPRCAHTPSL